jgi:DNA mismatch endonuclease (patch repair protein)
MRRDLPYPRPTSAAVTAAMKGNRRANTRPEVAVRSLLHQRGLRFRKDVAIRAETLRTTADIVFPRHRLAVFIDGCFWHQCPDHSHVPRANPGYWERKLARNVERDAEVTQALTAAGWTVVRIWEHEPAAEAADRIAETVAATRPGTGS